MECLFKNVCLEYYTGSTTSHGTNVKEQLIELMPLDMEVSIVEF